MKRARHSVLHEYGNEIDPERGGGAYRERKE